MFRWSDGTGTHQIDLWGDGQPDETLFGAQCAWQWANGTGDTPPNGEEDYGLFLFMIE